MVSEIQPGSCTLYNVWDDRHKDKVEVDSVVLCTQRLSNDSLYRELKADPAALEREGIEALYLIGDAQAPRMIVDSVFDGHRLAREIDSPNPAMEELQPHVVVVEHVFFQVNRRTAMSVVTRPARMIPARKTSGSTSPS